MGGCVDGWTGGWMDGWKDGLGDYLIRIKVLLRYKLFSYLFDNVNWYIVPVIFFEVFQKVHVSEEFLGGTPVVQYLVGEKVHRAVADMS